MKTSHKLGALIATDLGDCVYETMLNRDFPWHLDVNSSSLISNLTNDVEHAFASIQALILLITNFLIVLFLQITLMAIYPLPALVIGLSVAAFYSLVFLITKRSLKSKGKVVAHHFDRSIKLASESLGAIRDIIIDKRQSYFANRYSFASKQYRLAFADISIKTQLPRYLIESISLSALIVIMLIFILFDLDISTFIPLVGTLSLAFYKILQPSQQCFNSLGSIVANQESFHRISQFLSSVSFTNSHPSVPQIVDKTNTFSGLHSSISDKCRSELISIHSLSFQHKNSSKLVLDNVSLTIYKGEKVAFVGETGSGKSTLCDLMMGLLVPTKGSILIGHHDLHSDPTYISDWQTYISHVPQDIYLLDSSLTSNIAFAIDENLINHQRVRTAAIQANIHDTIISLDNQYDTYVGERGVLLSGGQRQRIAVARALYKEPKVLFFDEATSALDAKTEIRLMANISNSLHSTTLIVIAHKLESLRSFDKIFVLDKGRIVSSGNFQNLSTYCTYFQSLLSKSHA